MNPLGGLRQICTFRLEGQTFGVDVDLVQEILRFLPVTRIPLAPAPVAGLVNLRGQLVPAIDARLCVGIGSEGAPSEPTNVVVRATDGTVSLLVDDIGDVLEVDERDFEETPIHLPTALKRLLRGVYKLPQGLVLAIEAEAVIAASTARAGESERT